MFEELDGHGDRPEDQTPEVQIRPDYFDHNQPEKVAEKLSGLIDQFREEKLICLAGPRRIETRAEYSWHLQKLHNALLEVAKGYSSYVWTEDSELIEEIWDSFLSIRAEILEIIEMSDRADRRRAVA